MAANGNNARRFCGDCGKLLERGHAARCEVRNPRQAAPVGQVQGRNWEKEIAELARRLRVLETQPALPQFVGSSVEDMRHPVRGQPSGSVNRVFTLYLGLLPSTNTSGIVYVPMPRAEGVSSGAPNFLDIAPTMPGFSEWAQGYGDVSISSVAVVYTPTCAGVAGSAFLSIGFGRGDRTVSEPGIVNTMERATSFGWTTAGQLRTVYATGGAFDRHLLGGRQNRQARPWGRVYVVRSSTAFGLPGATSMTAYTGSLGNLRVVVQCACVRAEV